MKKILLLQCFPLDYSDRNLTPLDSGAEPHPTDPHPQTKKIWHAPIISPLCLSVGIFVSYVSRMYLLTYTVLHTPLMESTHFWFHSQHFNCSKVVNYFWSEKSLRFKINCFNNSWFVNSDLIDTKNVNFVQIAFI